MAPAGRVDARVVAMTATKTRTADQRRRAGLLGPDDRVGHVGHVGHVGLVGRADRADRVDRAGRACRVDRVGRVDRAAAGFGGLVVGVVRMWLPPSTKLYVCTN